MRIVGLIPARGGSKGIPGKNLVPLCGKPLLAWTIEAARGSARLTELAVSTDSDEIAAVARALGAGVLERPAALAADDTLMLPVIRHALEALGDVEVVVLLQPTSPLRRAEHVDAAVELLLADERADTVVSVVEVPHNLRPGKLLALDGGRLVALGSDPLHRSTAAVYARNGPAILALRTDRLGDDLYGGDVRPYVMAPLDSIDVDAPDDLRLAEALLRS